MVEALGNREHGRPPLPVDPEKEALQRQSQELQAKLQVMEQTVRIRQWLEQPDKKSMRRPNGIKSSVAITVVSVRTLWASYMTHRGTSHTDPRA
jgi:hypothetical protein